MSWYLIVPVTAAYIHPRTVSTRDADLSAENDPEAHRPKYTVPIGLLGESITAGLGTYPAHRRISMEIRCVDSVGCLSVGFS